MYWTIEKVMETAARSRTYRNFCRDFPIAYSTMRHRGWTDAIKLHCGWTDIDNKTVDADKDTMTLNEIIWGDACLYTEALDDPRWPMGETNIDNIEEELL